MRRTALALLLCLCPSALAQRSKPLLNLSAQPTVSAPAPGAGSATLALADKLAAQADALDSKDAAPRAQADARRLIAALLRTGETAGQAGSSRIVIARTLVRALPDIDRLTASASGPTAEADLALIAADLQSAAAALQDPAADAQRLTRDALAGLAQLSPTPAPATEPPRDWTSVQGLGPDLAKSLNQASALLVSAESWPAYRASAASVRATLREAGVAVAAPSPWLPPAAHQAMADQCAAAALALLAPDTRAAGAASLDRLARLGRLASGLDHAEDAAGKKARAALAAYIAAKPQPGPTTPSADADRLEACERIESLMLGRAALPDERALLRQIRPIWRSLLMAARQTESRLLPILETALASDSAMTDPAVLSAVAAHKQNLDDLRLLVRLNATITDASPADKPDREPAIIDKWKRIPDRLVKLTPDLAKPAEREAALTSLREMCRQIDRFAKMPGEDELRAAPSAPLAASWSRLTGGKGPELLTELSDRRSGWLQGWDRMGYAGAAADVQILDTLRSLFELLDQAAAADPAGPLYPTLNDTAAWELAPADLARLSGDLTPLCAQATAAITSGDADKAAGLIADLRARHAVTLLAGELARQLAAPADSAAAASQPPSPRRSPLLQACGAGDPPWATRFAPELADVCRYSSEAAANPRPGSPSEAFANARAAAILSSLDRAH